MTPGKQDDPRVADLPEHLGERIRSLRPLGTGNGVGEFVLYWMRTAVRGHENPALDAALHAAAALGVPVFVYHALSERYPFASDRHHRFILEGARDVRVELSERSIGYAFHLERPGHRGPALKELAGRAALVVTEDFPTPPMRAWTRAILDDTSTPLWVVDTACVVPMRLVGAKPTRAFSYRDATRDLREERLRRVWPEFDGPVREFLPDRLPFEPLDPGSDSIASWIASCDIDHGVAPVPDTPGGSAAGYERWDAFVANGLARYAARRNDPVADATSRMSAYLHYGHVSPLRLAREAAAHPGAGARKFLDELLVWRELAYTWCLRESDPENPACLPKWARDTLDAHASDPRTPLSWERLARARTGDPLWDLAQQSLLVHGELHNNVRMTWAKAIPAWCEDVPTALRTLIDLNHRYALDGRDPASYGGLLWCLGLFDRPMPGGGKVLGTIRGRSSRAQAGRIDMLSYRARVQRPRSASNPSVAVLGAGIAGLACARTLRDHGLAVTVFDKGRGPGGRASSKRTDEGHVDLGAQFFRARSESLVRHVLSWREEGVVAAWSARFLGPDGRPEEDASGDDPRWVGTPSMRAVPLHLARDLDVRGSVQIEAIRPQAGAWLLEAAGDTYGPFDRVVVTLPAPQACALLDDHPWAARLGAIRFAPCLAVAVKLPPGCDLGFDAMRPSAEAPLSWLAREASKPGRVDHGWWTLHASPQWSREHLEDAPDAFAASLLSWFAETFDAPAPESFVAHRWRYALVEEPLGEPCLHDPATGLAVGGDGLLGGRLEAAWTSGVALAGRLLGEVAAEPGGVVVGR